MKTNNIGKYMLIFITFQSHYIHLYCLFKHDNTYNYVLYCDIEQF